MSKKVTKEDIKSRLPQYIELDESTYINTQTKCRFIDIEFGEFFGVPNNVLRNKHIHPLRQKSNALSIDIVKNRLPRHIVLDDATYINTQSKCRFIDSEYGPFWARPNDVFYGHGHKKRGLITSIKKRTLNAQSIQDMLPEYLTLDQSTYINTKTKCRFIDSKYGEWLTTPGNVLSGNRHPHSRPQAVSTVKKRLSDYITLDESTYVNPNVKCRFIDSMYGEFYATPHSVNRGQQHPYRKRAKIVIELQQRLPSHITIDPNTYMYSKKKAKFIDSKYGEWWARPNDISNGCEHPQRNPIGVSVSEKEVCQFVNEYIQVSENIRFYYSGKNFFELDMFIPELQIGIEYHGLYWHSEINKPNNYHFEKREFFEKQGIQLLQFYENEWRDKQDIVKSIILAKIGKSELKYQARKLELKQVNNKDAQLFLKNNHLMGEYKTAKYIGLFDNNELISLLGYKRIKDGIDISRFCNKINTSVAGSYSKLLKYIEINEKPAFIQSFVDLRYGNGKALEKMGFKLEKITQGWNWTDCDTIYNRLHCKANMDDRKLTQKQHAKELRLYKIYDAGQAKYLKTF